MFQMTLMKSNVSSKTILPCGTSSRKRERERGRERKRKSVFDGGRPVIVVFV